jgi:hypothetical protein
VPDVDTGSGLRPWQDYPRPTPRRGPGTATPTDPNPRRTATRPTAVDVMIAKGCRAARFSGLFGRDSRCSWLTYHTEIKEGARLSTTVTDLNTRTNTATPPSHLSTCTPGPLFELSVITTGRVAGGRRGAESPGRPGRRWIGVVRA